MLPRSGDILCLTTSASVQFREPLYLRVIRVHDWPTYDGWIWLDGYELNSNGDAVERRSVFVQIDGIKVIGPAKVEPAGAGRPPGDPVPNGRRPRR